MVHIATLGRLTVNLLQTSSRQVPCMQNVSRGHPYSVAQITRMALLSVLNAGAVQVVRADKDGLYAIAGQIGGLCIRC